MPNIKSVIKDVKKSRERRLRNVSTKSRIKTLTKKAKAAIDANAENAAILISEAVSVIDKAAKRGIIHPNAAARRKSKLMKYANRAAAATQP
ncbi:MAG: 30S ribosomal protein S20 [Armatimonadota bacterium]|nr:30S ribosomal protein S20 [Armatimonadota bacterium]